jgi:hypothetical protein
MKKRLSILVVLLCSVASYSYSQSTTSVHRLETKLLITNSLLGICVIPMSD